MSSLPAEFFATTHALGVAESREILWISVPEQRLRLFVDRLPIAEFSVSTAKNGVGCRRESFQTPIGLHRIAQKIGDGQPVGTIFKERRAIGTHELRVESRLRKLSRARGAGSRAATNHESRITNHEDLILTRILWLEGLHPGVNQGGAVDTFSRYIYIHGTNQEELIGQPASHGCIRMRNDDVIRLFDAVEVGTLVWMQALT